MRTLPRAEVESFVALSAGQKERRPVAGVEALLDGEAMAGEFVGHGLRLPRQETGKDQAPGCFG